jgi:hypothetical protein
MARRLELDELVEHFTLLPDEAALPRDKSSAIRLGFAALLKFFTTMGRFPGGVASWRTRLWSSLPGRSEWRPASWGFMTGREAGQGAPGGDPDVPGVPGVLGRRR